MNSDGNWIGIGGVPTGNLHIFGGQDVGQNQRGYLVLGLPTDDNLAFDNNEIMARSNSELATLNLNVEGGNVILGRNGVEGRVGIGQDGPTDRLHVSSNAGESAFRVQVGGTTRLRVNANGGVAVGSNNSSVGSGDLAVAGDITAASVTVAPTTRWYTLSAADFLGATLYESNSGRLSIHTVSPNRIIAWAPVHLPHGAEVVALYATGYNLSDVDQLVVQLYRQELTPDGRQVMATVGSGLRADGGWGDSTPNIFNPVIDNVNYVYYVRVTFDAISHALYSARISYQTQSVLP